MVSKIHLPQEVGLNFSNVPIRDSPLHYSILLEPPPECSSFLEWAGYARGCNLKLHKCLTFYKERVVAHQEYFSSSEKLQLWENHPVVTVVSPRHS